MKEWNIKHHGFVTREMLIFIGLVAFGVAITLPTLRALTSHGFSSLNAMIVVAGVWLLFAAAWVLMKKASRSW